MSGQQDELSFWQHLDVMRGGLIRCALVTLVLSIVAFCCKDWLFSLLLAPTRSEFVTWRWLQQWHLMDAPERVILINTELSHQFIAHMQAALVIGLLMALPYIEMELYRFIQPALYEQERKHVLPALATAYVLFVLGAAMSYFILFPFTYRFLVTYQVAAAVGNYITLSSYLNTLLVLSLIMGCMTELPIVCRMLGKMGLITREGMRRYRRHAIVAIFILAAIITPTGDAITLSLVAVPIWLLYELSVWVIR